MLLTELPPEIIQNVLSQVKPRDLGRVPRVCKALNYAVVDNMTLFRAVYEVYLDTPPAQQIEGMNWEQMLKDMVRLRLLCKRKNIEDKKNELPFVYDTVTSLLKYAANDGPRASTSATHPESRNANFLARVFADETSQSAFLCRSSIYERARGDKIYSPPGGRSRRGSKHTRENDHDSTNHGTSSSSSSNNNNNQDRYFSLADRKRSAKLHCLYGKPIQYSEPHNLVRHRTRHNPVKMRPFACSRVYDLRQYNEHSQWGPFMSDSTGEPGGILVDWEMVEAIMIILSANLKNLGLETYPIYKNFWATPFAGVWPNSYMGLPLVPPSENPVQCENCSRPISVPPQPQAGNGDEAGDSENGEEGGSTAKKALDDPYGLNGTWLRVVCFLDYTDFFAYNFAHEHHPLSPDIPRPAIEVGEATRLILMKIAVSSIETPGPEDGQGMPVVHFKGISRSLDDSWDENANSDLIGTVNIRGTVRMTREGEVRWTTVSIFGGVERWKSESVQVGGIKSARGVLGNWFDRDYDPRGPVGPTAFWKISDRVAASNHEQRVMLSDFLPVMDGLMDDDEFEPSDMDDSDSNSDEEEEDEEEEDDDGEEGQGHGAEGDEDDEMDEDEDEDDEEDTTEYDAEMDEEINMTEEEFLRGLPDDVEIIDGLDVDIVGTQIIWTEHVAVNDEEQEEREERQDGDRDEPGHGHGHTHQM